MDSNQETRWWLSLITKGVIRSLALPIAQSCTVSKLRGGGELVPG